MADLDGVFKREWGTAVAALARWSGDLTVAEDAVQEAFTEALRAWPRAGVPDNPGAWVLTVARNRARDRLRRESVRPGKELAAVVDEIRARTDIADPHPVRDDELRMMFTCAHPALDRPSQLALTLRLVSGLTVAEIARALLQTESAIGQRITRAKNKIRHARIPLRVPSAEQLPERTPHVLGCIYSVFTEGYWSTAGPSAIRDELCSEGVRLAGELAALMPDESEAHALRALVTLHDARRCTRVDAHGALVPLDEQDRSRWDTAAIRRGLRHLQRAEAMSRLREEQTEAMSRLREGRGHGPYLPQAMIASLHATAPSWEQTDWVAICAAYDRLLAIGDSPVVRANRAVAVGFRDGFGAGLADLAAVADDPRLARSSLVPSIRADLLRRDGRLAEAVPWYRQALATSGSEPAKAFLRRRLSQCVEFLDA
jgi:RNA polymerase sigma-70 factor (ECF subfamily)